MAKLFNTRSMIFTLYGDYVSQYGNVIWIGSLIRLLEEFGHNEQSVRAAISRMNKQGWVKSQKNGNRSYYFLTERGKARMDEAAQRIYQIEAPSWDGQWRLLLYTIPEEKRHLRDELRQELVWSGFGLLSNSCWITPNPLEQQVKDLIKKYDIDAYVNFFHGTYEGTKENKDLVEQCWDLEAVNERYSQFIQAYSQKYIIDKSKIEKGEMNDGNCFVQRTLLVHQYRKFLFIDPSLPKELLPDNWLGDSAASLFTDYYQILKEPATRFFESVFDSGDINV
ncbi:MAG: phenylacetic acid degradation operon negative regulatory protein PaaX [Bacillota bacterium]|uniref:Phenylacetic acid degradation operon negative regulatory protein PaaX n=1 Tax=Virgibacillus salarius TaxID=447199 RepID=A0A941ICX1_9BACI|nr:MULTISPECIES: phenylacetic acid degradation operon negative regulatory protein PaaX [Virgibacillus]MBR7796590.1 phenylacetic acid degradation operon negative regulatory protein PaaX [Virgibacillus salarius]MCC2251686.1 phenylacetic acid degradation operon negative regulatory protein PaaX [Virgibacillus sp. AGTR]NAZ09299.1 phenylacetic acid degradation operon negative regulatory protein PaaX [Agaribacter marinus]QRZ19441.1 phenylacetic acid degradation operon negative regulatory protein PaaX 